MNMYNKVFKNKSFSNDEEILKSVENNLEIIKDIMDKDSFIIHSLFNAITELDKYLVIDDNVITKYRKVINFINKI